MSRIEHNVIRMHRSQCLSSFVCAAPHGNECDRFGTAIIQNHSTLSFVRELNIYLILGEREKQFWLFFTPASLVVLIFLKREGSESSEF